VKPLHFEIGTQLDFGRRRYVINDEGPSTRVLMDLHTGELRLLSLAQLRTLHLLGEIKLPCEMTMKSAEAAANDRAALVELRTLNRACPAGFVVVRRNDLTDLVRRLEARPQEQRQHGLWASGTRLRRSTSPSRQPSTNIERRRVYDRASGPLP